MPPRLKRAALHRDACIVIYDLVRRIVGRLGGCADVHGPLSGIILVKTGGLYVMDVYLVKLTVLPYPVCKVLFQRRPVTSIMAPLILPDAVLVVIAGPGHKRLGGLGI